MHSDLRPQQGIELALQRDDHGRIFAAMEEAHSGIISAVESLLSVEVSRSQDTILIKGADAAICEDLLKRVDKSLETTAEISAKDIMGMLDAYKPAPIEVATAPQAPLSRIATRKKTVLPAGPNQSSYIGHLLTKDLALGIGPAGTGKTFLAVGAGVQLLEAGEVDKIILTRPAVEAGEKLGYLPGDMKEKVDPFMQPLYDALKEFLAPKAVEKMMAEKVIEISPLAYMRGRTLKNAYVILDEAQNATVMQMKMFLTRLGEGSRMAVVGDIKQNDLPRGVESGLADAVEKLKGIPDVGIDTLTSRDVMRHPLVAKIIKAYDEE